MVELSLPIVSLLIATCNRFELSRKYIPQIIKRIGNIDADVLIWDNGSNDGTLDWLLSYKQFEPRIRKVLFSDTNIGMEAFNYLAKKTESKYIIKVDDDIDVPASFVKRLVNAYEFVNDKKLAYLGWDMQWCRGNSFATRSGMHLYRGNQGRIVNFAKGERILIHYFPRKWMVNGVCRLSLRERFLELGGHPIGIKYGVDTYVSRKAEQAGYSIGYFSSYDLVIHNGHDDVVAYRGMKDAELRRTKQM